MTSAYEPKPAGASQRSCCETCRPPPWSTIESARRSPAAHPELVTRSRDDGRIATKDPARRRKGRAGGRHRGGLGAEARSRVVKLLTTRSSRRWRARSQPAPDQDRDRITGALRLAHQPNSPGDKTKQVEINPLPANPREEILLSIPRGSRYARRRDPRLNPRRRSRVDRCGLEKLLARLEPTGAADALLLCFPTASSDIAPRTSRVTWAFQSLAERRKRSRVIVGLDVGASPISARGFETVSTSRPARSEVTQRRAEGVDIVTLESRTYAVRAHSPASTHGLG